MITKKRKLYLTLLAFVYCTTNQFQASMLWRGVKAFVNGCSTAVYYNRISPIYMRVVKKNLDMSYNNVVEKKEYTQSTIDETIERFDQLYWYYDVNKMTSQLNDLLKQQHAFFIHLHEKNFEMYKKTGDANSLKQSVKYLKKGREIVDELKNR